MRHQPLFTLYPWQMQVFNGLGLSDRDAGPRWKNSVHVVKSRRQCGKSFLLEAVLDTCAINRKGNSILIEPTNKQGRKFFKKMKRYLVDRVPELIQNSNESELYLEFVTGGSVQILSAEMDDSALRGYTVTDGGILAIDEGAYIPDWVYDVVLPFTDVSGAPVLITSTPKTKSGRYWRYWDLAQQGKPGIYCYDFGDFDTSRLLPPDKIEFYRETLTAQRFKTDIMGEWMEMESSVFGDFAPCLSNTYDGTEDAVYLGVDWGQPGKGKDYSVISGVNKKHQMVYLRYFNMLDTNGVVQAVCDACAALRPKIVLVEENSIGAVYFDVLRGELRNRKIAVNIRTFNTNNESKNRIIDRLKVAIEHRDITLFDDDQLIMQFNEYEQQRTPTGKITYNARSGYHDDIVMATALALEATTMGSYCVSVV